MSLKRYNIQLAYKEPLSTTLKGKLVALENILRDVKKSAVKINTGMANEENTTKATIHTCHHDTGKACELEVEI